ncbi:aspartate carbamoyltransferase [Spirochaetota bacterium]|nr:aspartate carbamoyltransferase [Spirochaetota bacterium]
MTAHLDNHTVPSWDLFRKFTIEKRIAFFALDRHPVHILYARQFTRTFLDELYILTNKIRLIAKTNHGKSWLSTLLENRRVMLYFAQPSTRTFLSFATACETMGMRFYDVRSLETSSEMKGETFEDTIRTFSSYFDLVILRHATPNYAEHAAIVLNRSRRPIPLINAGSSKDEHPTQALLDIFTLRKSFEKLGGLSRKTVMLVGDLKRGRTVRSLAVLLAQFAPIHIIFCAPKELAIDDEIIAFLKDHNVTCTQTTDFEANLPKTDAVYMTRTQSEYTDAKSLASSSKAYHTAAYTLTQKHLNHLKPNSIIMHPLPRKNEIAREIDNDPRAMYWRQVRNGMWTRCALIAKIFNIEKKILDH